MKTLSIIVPVYYNEQSLPFLYTELVKVEQQLEQKGVKLELIFVDDGSGDNSFNELMKIKFQRNETKIIKLTRNFGSVHASKTGLQFVTGDCFMILPADLQDPPELALEMVDKWLAGSKYVIAARASRDDPFMGKVLASFYYKLLRLFVVKDYPQGGYDVALMDRVILPYMQQSSKNINTPLLAYWLGFKPEIIPYNRLPRLHGKSRWTLMKRIKFFIDSILGFSIAPIRFISVIGLIVSLFSFAYGITVVISALLGKVAVPGFSTLAALISFLLGLIIIMLGMIGEYIWRIFDETNKRPETVIDEIY